MDFSLCACDVFNFHNSIGFGRLNFQVKALHYIQTVAQQGSRIAQKSFRWPPSWSLDVSETKERRKCLCVRVVGLKNIFPPAESPPPLSTGILYSSQCRSHRGTKMARSHGKIGDCEQSTLGGAPTWRLLYKAL